MPLAFCVGFALLVAHVHLAMPTGTRMIQARRALQAPLVQLDRMSAYGADGRRFESCTGCFGVLGGNSASGQHMGAKFPYFVSFVGAVGSA